MVPSMLDLDIDGLLNESKIKLLTAFNNDPSNETESSNNSSSSNNNNKNNSHGTEESMEVDILDGQMTEYDKALFAEVDKLSNSALVHTLSDDSTQISDTQDSLSTEKIRPLSPESLFDDLSVSNSPLVNKDHQSTQSSNQEQPYHYNEHEIERGLQQIQDYNELLSNYNDLKEEYATKCKELNKVLSIFKEMESKRFDLTQENQYLRNSLSQLLFRSGQSDITTHPFQL